MDWKSRKGKIVLAVGSFIMMMLFLSPFIATVWFSTTSVSEVKVADTTAEEISPGVSEYKVKITEGFFGEFCPVGKPCVPLEYKENVITTCVGCGLDHLEFLMGVGGNSPVKYLALGNGSTPSAGDDALDSEIAECGLERKAGDYYNLGVGHWEINTTFTYTCDTEMIANNTANFNATSEGVMYAGGSISSVPFATNGDQCKLRHNFTISEA